MVLKRDNVWKKTFFFFFENWWEWGSVTGDPRAEVQDAINILQCRASPTRKSDLSPDVSKRGGRGTLATGSPKDDPDPSCASH